MSTRSLRARLDRLTRSANSAIKQRKDGFTVDPALAKSLRDDYERVEFLYLKRVAPREYGGPPTPAEIEEEGVLPARVAERAGAIECPPDYRPDNDSDRLSELRSKRKSPSSCGGGPLNEVEDAEEAQLRARVEAYRQTPEGRALDRKAELVFKEITGGLNTTEQNELDGLRTLYPDQPLDQKHPLYDALLACKAASKKFRDGGYEQQQNRVASRGRLSPMPTIE
jgi:hypothetical protein